MMTTYPSVPSGVPAHSRAAAPKPPSQVYSAGRVSVIAGLDSGVRMRAGGPVFPTRLHNVSPTDVHETVIRSKMVLSTSRSVPQMSCAAGSQVTSS